MSAPNLVEIGQKALIPAPSDHEWRYLFIERAEAFPGEAVQRTDIPGGRLEDADLASPHTNLSGGVEREIREETGLDIVRGGDNEPIPLHLQLIPRQPEALDVVRFTFLARVSHGPVRLSGEHTDYNYLTRSEALGANVDPYLRELLERDDLFIFEQAFSPAQLSLSAMQRLVLGHSLAA